MRHCARPARASPNSPYGPSSRPSPSPPLNARAAPRIRPRRAARASTARPGTAPARRAPWRRNGARARSVSSSARCFFISRQRGFEIAVDDLALLQRPPPEFALLGRAAAERQHHRQGDLALAEIVADVLAELGRRAAVVERVVDQLEGDAEIGAVAAAGRDLRLAAPGEDRRRPRRRRRTAPRSWRGSPRDRRPRWSRCPWRPKAASPRPRRSPPRRSTARRGRRSEPTSTIILKAWPSRKSPTSTLASLPHSTRAATLPRRRSLSSTTSSCSSVAVCMNSTAAASLTWPSPR